ncbi:glycosyltransferase family 4 protein [uncultured Winogradskyella sp.]|uniref:glycosyltransferase family 4 protein n=1 Tax=uncultured Winogradskyella sp. TaxID=395353 RepID=UPI002602920A|nr:glycosyltransferase family 4 protein [uncultured Winogradskyella sp.]
MSVSKSDIITIGLVLSSVPGYSETFFRSKIKGLQRHGFKVILFVDYINEDEADLGCEVVVAKNFNAGVLKNTWYSFLALLKSFFLHPSKSLTLYRLNKIDGISFKENFKQVILNQFFLAQNVDWLHFGFGMLAVHRENVAEAMQAKMAISFRGFDLYLSPLKHPKCYDLLFKKDIKYHVLSQEMKEDLLNYNINSKNIKVITPAINTQFFKSERQAVFTEKIQLITVARLHWKKGIEYTLEALAHLKNKGIAFHYTVIGDGAERERLIFAAHQLGILDQVTFTGKLSQNEVKTKLEKANIYIQYSIQEGFCNAVLEAQVLGLMCVVSNAEGLSENVLDGETGWVVTKRKPKLLTEKIVEIINVSEDLKQKMRNVAISRVLSEFNLEKQQEKFVHFYQN